MKGVKEAKRCECNEKGTLNQGMEHMYDPELELPFVNHEPNECKCMNGLKLYKREGVLTWLCSCCNMGADEEVKP